MISCTNRLIDVEIVRATDVQWCWSSDMLLRILTTRLTWIANWIQRPQPGSRCCHIYFQFMWLAGA